LSRLRILRSTNKHKNQRMKPPKPFCSNSNNNIKAFVLGCDPTAFDKQGNRLKFEYVFDLGNDERYFSGVLKNLELIGLTLDDIYVQNLVVEYQEEETSKNKNWKKVAEKSILERKKEFDSIDKSGDIPVFLTSELLYQVLINPGAPKYKAKEFYDMEAPLPIPSSRNLFCRPLFLLYRHYRYKLSEHNGYLKYLQSFYKKE